MLSAEEVERIEARWRPRDWPDWADAYTLASFRRPFSYYVERVRRLGLSGGVLFDAGCGAGRWAFAFATVFSPRCRVRLHASAHRRRELAARAL